MDLAHSPESKGICWPPQGVIRVSAATPPPCPPLQDSQSGQLAHVGEGGIAQRTDLVVAQVPGIDKSSGGQRIATPPAHRQGSICSGGRGEEQGRALNPLNPSASPHTLPVELSSPSAPLTHSPQGSQWRASLDSDDPVSVCGTPCSQLTPKVLE